MKQPFPPILLQICFGKPLIYIHYFISGSNDILEELDLSWNQIRQRGGVCIAKGLKVDC